MRFIIFALFAVVAIFISCSETPQYKGAAVDNDQNVLTGGPITGTTIEDLPAVVKETLKERVPHGEIASITKSRQDGTVIYDVSFLNSENPDIYLRADGQVVPEPPRVKK